MICQKLQKVTNWTKRRINWPRIAITHRCPLCLQSMKIRKISHYKIRNFIREVILWQDLKLIVEETVWGKYLHIIQVEVRNLKSQIIEVGALEIF